MMVQLQLMLPNYLRGEFLELWQDSNKNESSRESCSRLWAGSAPDVAEVNLDDSASQKEAISLIGMIPWILVRCSDWKMIPLENLISNSSGSGTKIAVAINKIVDINGAAFALEHGVDAILLPSHDDELWNEAELISSNKTIKVTSNHITDLSSAKVVSIESSGIGERVCIDLIERLEVGEGMVIGSTSFSLALVHGETIESEYVPSRPFRVNAGSVHSYVLMADGSTRYLSELSAGDEVAIFSHSGQRRKCIIGRLKIEKRPFLIIRFTSESNFEGQIMLQQAETVRLVDKSGDIISVTDVKIGDEIIVRNDNQMRHIGNALDGEMTEK
jgi:3-dehydroquinate synthase II